MTSITVCSFLEAQPYQANGLRVGEPTQNSAVVWTRLTSIEEANTFSIEESAPGFAGQVRVAWWPESSPNLTTTSAWTTVGPSTDYATQFELTGLDSNTRYLVRSETRANGSSPISSNKMGKFITAPTPDDIVEVLATVVTCQGIDSADSATNGHKVYDEMSLLNPHFFVHTGDILYYDRRVENVPNNLTHPFSDSLPKARQRWNRMHSFTWNREFGANFGSYYIKDDHDTLRDDSWPGQTFGQLTFAQGQATFLEQLPTGPLPYRTIRWGKDLQIWLLEGRDFRSPNNIADGPNKTILGATQKAWLKSTLEASDASFKLVISASPIVGPDRPTKRDNHSNSNFRNEGDELRQFISNIPNAYIVNGDRHWQYASIDPATKLREYGCGPINFEHSRTGGGVTFQPEFHSFFAARGGYLSILVNRQGASPQVTFRYHDIDLTNPMTGIATIVYEETLRLSDVGLVTLTRDNIENTIKLETMSNIDKFYHVESSEDLLNWEFVELNREGRGSLIRFETELENDKSRLFYRFIETDERINENPGFLAPHTVANQGSTFNSDQINRSRFVADLVFQTPADLDATTEMLLVEIGGGTRGTGVAIVDGKLVVTAGQINADIINYTGDNLLDPDTRYSLRITALADAGSNPESFQADFWKAGDASSITIIQQAGLALDGFSGSDIGGLGVVGETIFSSGLPLPTTAPPAGTISSFAIYDPTAATADAVLPDQPTP